MSNLAEDRGPGRPRCQDTRQSILRAAYEMFEEGEDQPFTIEAVARRSGAAKTTIYRWWPSKGALAIEAFLAIAEKRSAFPETESAVADLRMQVKLLARLLQLVHMADELPGLEKDRLALEREELVIGVDPGRQGDGDHGDASSRGDRCPSVMRIALRPPARKTKPRPPLSWYNEAESGRRPTPSGSYCREGVARIPSRTISTRLLIAPSSPSPFFRISRR